MGNLGSVFLLIWALLLPSSPPPAPLPPHPPPHPKPPYCPPLLIYFIYIFLFCISSPFHINPNSTVIFEFNLPVINIIIINNEYIFNWIWGRYVIIGQKESQAQLFAVIVESRWEIKQLCLSKIKCFLKLTGNSCWNGREQLSRCYDVYFFLKFTGMGTEMAEISWAWAKKNTFYLKIRWKFCEDLTSFGWDIEFLDSLFSGGPSAHSWELYFFVSTHWATFIFITHPKFCTI